MTKEESNGLTDDVPVFVFGSNEAGRHGKGAALWAKQHRGAVYGQGIGEWGKSYALPTKDRYLKTHSLDTIRLYVEQFKEHAACNPSKQYQLTPIGCGLAGYKPEQIAPMFKDAPPNVIMPEEFKSLL